MDECRYYYFPGSCYPYSAFATVGEAGAISEKESPALSDVQCWVLVSVTIYPFPAIFGLIISSSSLTIVSCVRLQTLVYFENTQNLTRKPPPFLKGLHLESKTSTDISNRRLCQSWLLVHHRSPRRYNLRLYARHPPAPPQCLSRTGIDQSGFQAHYERVWERV